MGPALRFFQSGFTARFLSFFHKTKMPVLAQSGAVALFPIFHSEASLATWDAKIVNLHNEFRGGPYSTLGLNSQIQPTLDSEHHYKAIDPFIYFALEQLRANKTTAAIAAYQKAHDIMPGPWQVDASFAIAIAACKLRQAQFKSVVMMLEPYEKALSSNVPLSDCGYFRAILTSLAVAHTGLEKYSAAIACLKKANAISTHKNKDSPLQLAIENNFGIINKLMDESKPCESKHPQNKFLR
jgi:hypothetical protein